MGRSAWIGKKEEVNMRLLLHAMRLVFEVTPGTQTWSTVHSIRRPVGP